MEIKVVNVKCWWCAKTVKNELEKLWINNIEVSFTKSDSAKSRLIKFDWDLKIVKNKMTNLGYPEVWSQEADSVLKKAKSFVSCAIWKIR